MSPSMPRGELVRVSLAIIVIAVCVWALAALLTVVSVFADEYVK